MKFQLTFLLGLLFSVPSFAQLFHARQGWYNLFVEIRQDIAHVEIFNVNPHGFVYKLSDEILLPLSNSADTAFTGNQNQILKIRNKYYLAFNYFNKTKSKQLKLAKTDYRESLRKQAYSTKKAEYLRKLEDSLVTDGKFPRYILYDFRDSISYDQHVRKVDSIADSVSTSILININPAVSAYYEKAEKIHNLDSTEIYELLSQANYSYNSTKYFVFKLSQSKPEYLINYVEQEPQNKKELLRLIKNHNYYKEIVKNVNESPGKPKAKKEIRKQKTKRNLENTGIAVAYISIILAELAVIPLVLIWIF